MQAHVCSQSRKPRPSVWPRPLSGSHAHFLRGPAHRFAPQNGGKSRPPTSLHRPSLPVALPWQRRGGAKPCCRSRFVRRKDSSSSSLPSWLTRRLFRSLRRSGTLKPLATYFKGYSFIILDVGTDVHYFHGGLIAEFITVLNL